MIQHSTGFRHTKMDLSKESITYRVIVQWFELPAERLIDRIKIHCVSLKSLTLEMQDKSVPEETWTSETAMQLMRGGLHCLERFKWQILDRLEDELFNEAEASKFPKVNSD